MRTTAQIRRNLARGFRGGELADSVLRLLVVYDAFQELEHLVSRDWRVEYDAETVSLYLVRRDGLRTEPFYSDSETEIVVTLLDAADTLEFHAGALGYDDDDDDRPRDLVRVRVPFPS